MGHKRLSRAESLLVYARTQGWGGCLTRHMSMDTRKAPEALLACLYARSGWVSRASHNKHGHAEGPGTGGPVRQQWHVFSSSCTITTLYGLLDGTSFSFDSLQNLLRPAVRDLYLLLYRDRKQRKTSVTITEIQNANVSNA